MVQCSSPSRRIAVIVCGQPPPELYEVHGTYGPFFERLLRRSSEEEEEWRMFDVYKDEFPSAEELKGFDAVIVTGSKCAPSLFPLPSEHIPYSRT